MDWIERLFGVSPDGGDGSLEMAIVTAALIAAILVFLSLSPAAREAIRRRLPGLSASDDDSRKR